MINLAQLARAPTESDPFPHFVAQDLIAPSDLANIARDFPHIDQPGLFQLSDLDFGPAFRGLVEDLQRSEFRTLMERKLGVSLAGRPLMITVRGWCSATRDGRTHTDSEDKIATGLLYLNDPEWESDGGRLRFLRSADLEDVIAEVPPTGGTMVAFRRSSNSWHGHHAYEGPRRYVMFNWMRSEAVLAKNVGRHKLSAIIKRLDPRHARAES